MQEGGDGVIGLGTIINVALILAGGLVGTVGGRLFTPHVQETLMKATGLSVLFVGLSGLAEPVRAAFVVLELAVLLAVARACAGRTMVRPNEGEDRHD